MGAEYAGYTADITASFPANGRFTESQKFVYNTCLKANRAVLTAMRPGSLILGEKVVRGFFLFILQSSATRVMHCMKAWNLGEDR